VSAISSAGPADDGAALLAALPPRVGSVVQRWALEAPDRVALLDRSGQWTYGQLAAAAARLSAKLTAGGVRGGDRVMVVAENCRGAVAVFLAVAAIDAWPVLVDARLAAPELAAIREDCQPRLVVVVGMSPVARTVAERLDAVPMDAGGIEGAFCAPIDPQATTEPVSSDSAEQVAAILYTSGSTGTPRGVMLSHRGILFVAASGGRIRTVTPDDRFYAVMPISHGVGLVPVLMCALMHGASVYLVARFNPAEALRAFRQDGITILLGTPALYSLVLDYAGSKKIQQIASPTLRIVSASGSPLDMALKHRAEALFGLSLHHGYGLTECSCTISQVRPELPRNDLSVGPLLAGMEARLADTEDGTGELQLRGPNLMLGYYRNHQASHSCFSQDGWFRTGDLARFEGDHLFIVGRLKEMVIRNGFKIQPIEVEAALNTHADVVLSAVISRRENGNDMLIAFVQTRPGAALSSGALMDHASRHLAAYKQPQHIVIAESLPLLPSGKVNKVALASGTY
jgi:acyl-CoA synthetase (AMP-forming)/AMP-acid ligase II